MTFTAQDHFSAFCVEKALLHGTASHQISYRSITLLHDNQLLTHRRVNCLRTSNPLGDPHAFVEVVPLYAKIFIVA